MTYVQAFDIARLVVLNMPECDYRAGVERAAALAAVGLPDEAAAKAMCDVFENYLLAPRAWADPVI